VQDRPDAPELLAAVAAWLAEELAPGLPRDQRFLARVAANCCAIAAREAAAGPALAAEEAARLGALLGPGAAVAPTPAGLRAAQRELAGAIRAGRHDDRLASTAQALRASVRAKLDIARPGYDAVADDGR
jgi:Domain of unknown function (DUF6285)